MIARATLALMLAYPAAAAVLCSPPGAMAHDRRLPPPASEPTGKRDKATSSRRWRAFAHGRTHRRDLPAVLATLDDGLAYDTPRGPDGRPVALQLGARPIDLATQPLQIGIASWYGGKRWQGQRTSSGSRYDEQALTAAHATLPLGSQVRVRLINSDREITVTITDRPGTRRRIIDLSRGAAAALGILSQGVAEVSLQPL